MAASRGLFVVVAVLLAACGSAENSAPSDPAVALPAQPDEPARPNVVLYVIDTLRADSLGAYGNPDIETPKIDAFAAEGVVFERAYAPTSWTRASIASILTGLHPDTHELDDRDDPLAGDILTLAEHFSRAGYQTGAIVANPNVGSVYGFDRGWDEYIELYERRTPGRVISGELISNAEMITRRATRWLDEAGTPFFLFILSIDPHWPYSPPPGYDRYADDYSGPVSDGADGALTPGLDEADRQRIRAYYRSEVSYADGWFGRFLDELRRRQLADSTIVALTSDHGEEFWEHGQQFHGKTLFDESVRVPLILRRPGSVPAGRRISTPVELVDLAPTLLSLAGLAVPASVDGEVLDFDDASSERKVFSRLAFEGRDMYALTIWPWRLHHDANSDRSMLFDLERDPGETQDLINAEARRGAEMLAILERRTALSGTTRRAPTEKVPDDALPDATREALEALGYIDQP